MEAALGADGFGVGLVVAALLLGLRHGIDWDHIAALTDISASQDRPRSGFRLGTIYILGHAAVVIVLGVVAISLGSTIPSSVDNVMGKFVGITLVAMGAYILVSLLLYGAQFRMRSRWMLVLSGVRWLAAVARRPGPATTQHDHEHAAAANLHHAGGEPITAGDDARELHAHPHTHGARDGYGTGTAAGIGVIHGVGAETPTQVVIFLAAANAGGFAAGIAVLLVFVVGLVASNLALNLASSFGFLAAGRNPRIRVALGATTAAVSLALGVVLLVGADAGLPTLFVG